MLKLTSLKQNPLVCWIFINIHGKSQFSFSAQGKKISPKMIIGSIVQSNLPLQPETVARKNPQTRKKGQKWTIIFLVLLYSPARKGLTELIFLIQIARNLNNINEKDDI